MPRRITGWREPRGRRPRQLWNWKLEHHERQTAIHHQEACRLRWWLLLDRWRQMRSHQPRRWWMLLGIEEGWLLRWIRSSQEHWFCLLWRHRRRYRYSWMLVHPPRWIHEDSYLRKEPNQAVCRTKGWHQEVGLPVLDKVLCRYQAVYKLLQLKVQRRIKVKININVNNS